MVKLALHGRTVVAAAIFFVGGGCALRALLGRGGGLPQPALRDLLPPGDRVLHRARAWRASSPARRASTRSAAASSPPSPGRRTTSPMAQFRAAIADYLAREGAAVEAYAHEVQGHVPYRGRRDADRSRENDHLALPARCARVVSAARAGARGARGAAGRRRRSLARSGCWPPTAAASFPGIPPVSRCCGGRPTRAPCSSRKSFTSRAAWRRPLRSGGFTASLDEDFAGVIDGCAAPRAASPGTWITQRDARRVPAAAPPRASRTASRSASDGMLVGGLYGVRLGGVFFGESMFSRGRDASKAALAHLVALCRAQRPRGHRLPAALAAPGEPRRALHPARPVPGAAGRACPRRRRGARKSLKIIEIARARSRRLRQIARAARFMLQFAPREAA